MTRVYKMYKQEDRLLNFSGDGWMYPYQTYPYGKSLCKPEKYSGYLWVLIPKNPEQTPAK